MDVTSYQFHQKQSSCNRKINPLESGWKVVGKWLEVSFQKTRQIGTLPQVRLTNAPRMLPGTLACAIGLPVRLEIWLNLSVSEM